MSLIKEHWAKIAGPVHPDDIDIFNTSKGHSFHLDFPPPAFVGNLNAPIIVLMANGGYKPGVTEREFAERASVEHHLAYLRGETSDMPVRLSDYYVKGPFGGLLESQRVLLINAVPYRSPQLSKEKANEATARRLKSVAVHRRWLHEEVVPQARRGERFILAHRYRWWDLPLSEACENIVFSDGRAEPNRRAPDAAKLQKAIDWCESWQGTRPINT